MLNNELFLGEIRERISQHLEGEAKNIFAVTGPLGVSIGKSNYFSKVARRAAENGCCERERDIYWIPLSHNNKTVVVCGLKGVKKYPEEEILLLNKIMQLSVAEVIEKTEIEKFVDIRSDFVKKLLFDKTNMPGSYYKDKADIVGINLRCPQAMMIFKVHDFRKKNGVIFEDSENVRTDESAYIDGVRKQQNFLNSISKSFMENEENVFAHLEGDEFVVLKSFRSSDSHVNNIKYFKKKAHYIQEMVKELTGLKTTIGIGNYYSGISGIKKSFNDARVAIEIGEKIYGKNDVYHISDIGPLASVSDSISLPQKRRLSKSILDSISKNEELSKTVTEFFNNNLSPTATSKKINIHRNTLIYRLNKVRDITGLDPRVFDDAVRLKLCLSVEEPEVIA